MICFLLLVLLAQAAEPVLYFPLEADENPVKNHGSANVTAEPLLIKPSHFTPAVVNNGLRIYGMADGLQINKPGDIISAPCTVSFFFRPERLHERMTLCCFYIADEQLLALKIQNGALTMLDWSDSKNRKTYPCSKKS